MGERAFNIPGLSRQRNRAAKSPLQKTRVNIIDIPLAATNRGRVTLERSDNGGPLCNALQQNKDCPHALTRTTNSQQEQNGAQSNVGDLDTRHTVSDLLGLNSTNASWNEELRMYYAAITY